MTRSEEIAAVEEGAYALLREGNYQGAMRLLSMALRWRYLDPLPENVVPITDRIGQYSVKVPCS